MSHQFTKTQYEHKQNKNCTDALSVYNKHKLYSETLGRPHEPGDLCQVGYTSQLNGKQKP